MTAASPNGQALSPQLSSATIVESIPHIAWVADADGAIEYFNRSGSGSGSAVVQMGCAFAIDDFGAGFAGFSYLTRLPVTSLKIDRECIRDLAASEPNRHVVKAIVGLAQGFGLQTAAEGVEDEETLTIVRDLGLDYARGFQLGVPVPILPGDAERPRRVVRRKRSGKGYGRVEMGGGRCPRQARTISPMTS